jgi:hypothetical protein
MNHVGTEAPLDRGNDAVCVILSLALQRLGWLLCCLCFITQDLVHYMGIRHTAILAGPVTSQPIQTSSTPRASPTFLDGVASIKIIASGYDKAYYRLLSTPEVTWLYVEMFNLESQARQFCEIAGSKLASITSAADTEQIEQLLNITLTPRAESNFNASKAKVIMWIDLKRASGDKAETRWVWGSLVRGTRNTIVVKGEGG